MEIKFVEAGQDLKGGNGNWGKFAIGRWTLEELNESSVIDPRDRRGLILGRGWDLRHIWVLDIQTGEGAMFLPGGGFARADLNKRKIWVCPLFEPFLEWLYQHVHDKEGDWWQDLPRVIELPDAPFEIYGHRRPGPEIVSMDTISGDPT